MFLNYDYPEIELDHLLDEIKEGNIDEKITAIKIKKIVKDMVRVHKRKVENNHGGKYNCQQLISKVNGTKNVKSKDEIVSSLKIMEQVEHYSNTSTLKEGYLVWNMERNHCSHDIKDMYIGSYIWDIAAIINYMNNQRFSEIFIDNYLIMSEYEITLSALYCNIFYIQVYNALVNDNEDSIIESAKQILQDGGYHSDLISYETLKKLNISGYA